MTVSPGAYDITAYTNADYVQTFAFKNADGTAFDFTGHTGELQVRQYGGAGGSPLISLANVTSGGGGVWIYDAVHGLIQVTISRDQLSAVYSANSTGLAAGSPICLAYDLITKEPTGLVDIWVTGKFNINPGVTIYV
jgi:hypothetical protein